MRLKDLPVGAVRAPASKSPLYVPGPPPRRAWGRALGVRVALAGLAFIAMAGGIGEQSVLAALGDRPSWRPALKAADPGVALSPHMTTVAGPASVADAPAPEVRAKKADRLPGLALVAPAANPLTELAGLLARPAGIVPSVAARPAERPRAQTAAATPPLVSAYAADRVTIETPFELLLQGETGAAQRHGLVGGGKDHWWSDRPLPDDMASAKQLKCLTEAIYFEARGEPELGQAAVAQVVINRVKNPAYPDDTCSVVYQNRKWYNRCQFTFACDRRKDIVTNKAAWTTAQRIAEAYANGEMWLDSIGAATHYHAQRVEPKWSKLMRRVKTIDNHVFYITKGGGWT